MSKETAWDALIHGIPIASSAAELSALNDSTEVDKARHSWEPAARHYRDLNDDERAAHGQ